MDGGISAAERVIGRPWQKGVSGNPSGRPKKLQEIEAALDAEHRTVENMKEVFAQLRAMATEAVITRHTDKEGNTHESIKQPNPVFMKLYLDRVLGPVSDDASDKIRKLATEIVDQMLSEARARRQQAAGE